MQPARAIYTPGEYSGGIVIFKFTWNDIGNNQVDLTPDNSSYGIKMDYNVTGNSITLTMYYNGSKIVYCGTRVSSVPHGSAHANLSIGNWQIYVNGKQTKVIYAEPQPDGSATWSGELEIIAYDQNYNPLPEVTISLNGCSISLSGTTDSQGTLTLHIYGVTLPSGVASDTIEVRLQYNAQERTDTITVIRSS